MSSTSFLSRSNMFMPAPPREHYSSFAGESHASVDVQALYPAFGAKALQSLSLPPASQSISSSKLPSLEGLLKKMQDEPASPPSRGTHGSVFSQPFVGASQEHQRLSPAGREMAQMPSLRTLISPSVSRISSAHSSPVQASYALAAHQQQYESASHSQPLLSRKRSWMEATSAASVLYPMKDRAVSPSLSVSSSHSGVSSSAGPVRSRASKYCKIEGCERVSQRNNLCHSHGGKRLCKEEKCSSKDRGNGYCIKHGGGKICSMENCEKKARRKGLCTQHFRVCDDGVVDGMAALHYASTM